MRHMRRFGFGLLAAATLLCGLGAASAEAGTLTVSFSGAVVDHFGTTTAGIGDAVHGTMVFHGIDSAPSHATDDGVYAVNQFSSGHITWDISVGALSPVGGAGQDVVSSWSNSGGAGGPAYAGISLGSGFSADNNYLSLEFDNLHADAGADYHGRLLSLLSNLPSSVGAMAALLGGTLESPYGSFPVGLLQIAAGSPGSAGIEFSIDKFSATYAAVTPIPATLPLFATALIGVGGLAWRKKKAAA